MSSINHVIHAPCHQYTMPSINHNIHTPCHQLTITCIQHNVHSSEHQFLMSASHQVIHSQCCILPCCIPCHLFTVLVHAVHLCHPVINSPCHPVTLSSIHPAINSHLPCRPFTFSSSLDHGPCHPFTMSSIQRLSQSPCHSGSISSYHFQVTRPEDLNQKEFPVLLEITLARGASTLGQILLSLFCLCYLPLLLESSDPPPFHC